LGSVHVIDFMLPREQASDVVRIVVGERGEVRMRTELIIRFDFPQAFSHLSLVGTAFNLWHGEQLRQRSESSQR
jgi:hypothetical protein